jgi:hypothetical protein
MTLKEKLHDEYIWTTEPIIDAEEVSESVDKMIKVANKFAIEFAEWIEKYQGGTPNLKVLKELLEIYKIEKGL